MDNGPIAHPFAGKPNHCLGGIKGNDLIAALSKRQGIPSHATSGIEDTPAWPDMTEKALIKRLQIQVGHLRGKFRGVPVIIADGINHRIIHRL